MFTSDEATEKKEDSEDEEAGAASQRKDNYIWNWLYIKFNLLLYFNLAVV